MEQYRDTESFNLNVCGSNDKVAYMERSDEDPWSEGDFLWAFIAFRCTLGLRACHFHSGVRIVKQNSYCWGPRNTTRLPCTI